MKYDTNVLAVECPWCKVPAKAPCVLPSQQRREVWPHPSRYEAAGVMFRPNGEAYAFTEDDRSYAGDTQHKEIR